MGLFSNPRKKIEKWAPIVMEGYVPEMPVEEEFLDAATSLYIQQHARILYDCIRLVCTSKNWKTKQERYELACKKYGALSKVRKYANKEQKQIIDRAIDDFIQMQDIYKHPKKYAPIEYEESNSKQMKEDFWDVYAQGEMLDIFSGKKK